MTTADESPGAWMSSDYREGLVSVIVPTYNRADLLVEALESVEAQTHRPIEVLVVDDGSTDGTEKAVGAWSESACRPDFAVVYIRQENLGAPTARNCGCARSTGEFIQFFDSDDLLHPLKLEIQVAMLREYPDCDFAWCGHVRFRNVQRPEVGLTNPAGGSRKAVARLFENFPGTVWGNLFRRHTVLENGPWATHLKKWQDLEYVTRLSCLKQRLAVSRDDKLYHFRIHDSGRIADLYKVAAGVDAGFESLRLMCCTLDETGQWNLHVGKCICQFYMGLALQAMKSGTTAQVEFAFEKSLAISTYPGFLNKLRLLRTFYRFFGPLLSRVLMQAYSGITLRIGSANAHR